MIIADLVIRNFLNKNVHKPRHFLDQWDLSKHYSLCTNGVDEVYSTYFLNVKVMEHLICTSSTTLHLWGWCLGQVILWNSFTPLNIGIRWNKSKYALLAMFKLQHCSMIRYQVKLYASHGFQPSWIRLYRRMIQGFQGTATARRQISWMHRFSWCCTNLSIGIV